MKILVAATILLLLAGNAGAADLPNPAPSALKEIAAYAEAEPADLAGLRDRCLDARTNSAPESYEYAVLTKRIADLDKVVGAPYRAIRPADSPPTKLTGAERTKLALMLLRDLKSRSIEARRTAILYLGRLGSETGVSALVRELGKTKDTGIRSSVVAALKLIGGPAVGRRLGEKIPMAGVAAQAAALNVLSPLVRSPDAEVARRASLAIGEFIFSRDPGIAERAIALLGAAGEAGVEGLERGSEIRDHQLRVLVISALGDTGAGRAAAICARFLTHSRGWRSGQSEYAAAARASIVRIGRPAVPYLSGYLLDSRRRRATRSCLRAITGRYFARPDEVAKWWSPHYRKKSKE